jgi:hypothetical protein
MQVLVPCDFLSSLRCDDTVVNCGLNRLNAELNPNCCLLALLGAHHFLHVSRIRVNGGTNVIILYQWYNRKTQNVIPLLNVLLLFLFHEHAQIVQ